MHIAIVFLILQTILVFDDDNLTNYNGRFGMKLFDTTLNISRVSNNNSTRNGIGNITPHVGIKTFQ